MVAINTRCLDEVDAATLNVRHFDGKAFSRGRPVARGTAPC